MSDTFKKILKKINELPIPITIKHYYVFGEVTHLLKNHENNSAESWETLRVNHPNFYISENRDQWLKSCELMSKKDGQDSNLVKRAHHIVKILEYLKIESIFSIGVGGAALEYNIKKIKPGIKLTCSEYNNLNVELLNKVFFECNSIVFFDIRNKDWQFALPSTNLNSQLVLINRIDTSLTDDEWRDVFKNMYNLKVQNILFITTTCLTILSFLIRMRRRFYRKIHHQTMSFAGYLRTKKTFRSFWQSLYYEEEIELEGLRSFLLKRIN